MRRAKAAACAFGAIVLAGAMHVSDATAEPCKGCDGIDWTFGASTSYNYDFNSPDEDSLNTATYSNLEQDESFNIDLVQLGLTGQRGRMGYGAKLDFGDLTAFAGDSEDGDVALQDAYLTFDGDGVGILAGRFGTPIGFEVLEPWGNAQASRSWAWNAQPVNHDGVALNGSADFVDVMIGLVNSFTVDDPLANDIDDEKGVIGSLGAGVSDALNFYFAGIYTEEGDTVDIGALNAVVSGDIDVVERDLRYAIEAYWRRDDPKAGNGLDFWSVVGYVGADVVGPFTFDLRIEYADDEGIVLGDDSDVISATPTLSVHVVEGVDFRVEYRFDKAGEDVFLDDSDPDDTLHTITGQLTWSPEL